ncbi:hypothetical protein K491DRAFT_723724 [Lophiostoma macrostomum CBS 122681]|uniref:Uncharacterized protein n=1 Tax=Lophiostoma macrostomum CBS 122681 TaxID=1314788 RepID=A0A6A6SLN7_9PLEO|nr:hypothetical protein K491DRAFT_723724 [Lophiostoma macrostomum CBS 122681]
MANESPYLHQASSANHSLLMDVEGGSDDDPSLLTNANEVSDTSRKHDRSASNDTNNGTGSSPLRKPELKRNRRNVNFVVNADQVDTVDSLKDQSKRHDELPYLSLALSRGLQQSGLPYLHLPVMSFPSSVPRSSETSRPMTADEARQFHLLNDAEQEAVCHGYNPFARNASPATYGTGSKGFQPGSPAFPSPYSQTNPPTGYLQVPQQGTRRETPLQGPQEHGNRRSGNPDSRIHGQVGNGTRYLSRTATNAGPFGPSMRTQEGSDQGNDSEGAATGQSSLTHGDSTDPDHTSQLGRNNATLYNGIRQHSGGRNGNKEYSGTGTAQHSGTGTAQHSGTGMGLPTGTGTGQSSGPGIGQSLGHGSGSGSMEDSGTNNFNGGSGPLSTSPVGNSPGAIDQRGDGNAQTHITQVNHGGPNILVYPPHEFQHQDTGGTQFQTIPGQGDLRHVYHLSLETPYSFLGRPGQSDNYPDTVYDRRLFWNPKEALDPHTGLVDTSKLPCLPFDYKFLVWFGDSPLIRDLYHRFFMLTEQGPYRLTLIELQEWGLRDQAPGGINHPETLIGSGQADKIAENYMDHSYWFQKRYWDVKNSLINQNAFQSGGSTNGSLTDSQTSEDAEHSVGKGQATPTKGPAARKTTRKGKKTQNGHVGTETVPPKIQGEREKEDCPDGLRTQGHFWVLLGKNSGVDFAYNPPRSTKPPLLEKPKKDKISLGTLVANSVAEYKRKHPALQGNTRQIDVGPAAIKFPIKNQDGRIFKPLKSVATDEKVDLRLAGPIEWTLYELLAYAPGHLKSPDFYKRIKHLFACPKQKLDHAGNADACGYINYFRDLRTVADHLAYNTISSQHGDSRVLKAGENRIISQLDPETDFTVTDWHFADEWTHGKDPKRKSDLIDYPLLALKWGVCVEPQPEDKGPITLVMEYCEERAKDTPKYLMYMLSDVPQLLHEAAISRNIANPSNGKHPDEDFHDRHQVGMKTFWKPLKTLVAAKAAKAKKQKEANAAKDGSRSLAQQPVTPANPGEGEVEEFHDEDAEGESVTADQGNSFANKFSPSLETSGDYDEVTGRNSGLFNDSGFVDDSMSSPHVDGLSRSPFNRQVDIEDVDFEDVDFAIGDVDFEDDGFEYVSAGAEHSNE